MGPRHTTQNSPQPQSYEFGSNPLLCTGVSAPAWGTTSNLDSAGGQMPCPSDTPSLPLSGVCCKTFVNFLSHFV